MNEQDQRVRDYYENLSMPKDKLDLLIQETESRSEAEPSRLSVFVQRIRNSVSSPRRPADALMGLAVACGLFLLVSLWMFSGSSSLEHTQRTIREVAMNHTTRLEPEFRGDTLASLDNSMQQLPFALVLPESIGNAFELVGSRYCSLGGILAAHVKLKNSETGKPISLFVTSNGAALKDVRTQESTLEGVDVELWREGGLFFALAQRS